MPRGHSPGSDNVPTEQKDPTRCLGMAINLEWVFITTTGDSSHGVIHTLEARAILRPNPDPSRKMAFLAGAARVAVMSGVRHRFSAFAPPSLVSSISSRCMATGRVGSSKSHSASGKRFRLTASGRVKFNGNGRRHRAQSKNRKRIRSLGKARYAVGKVEKNIISLLSS